MKPVNDFICRLRSKVRLDQALVVRDKDRYFLLDESLRKLIGKGFFYAGMYLGKTKAGHFFPSFNLLALMAKGKANKVYVDDKTEWLFVCGKDIFRQGIVKVEGVRRGGEHVLVLSGRGECIGFGRILMDIGSRREGVVIKNVSDIGDFLRRERR